MPEDTLRAFRIAEKHIRDWSPPAEDAASPDAPKAVGVCITLKLRGDVVGRGMSWSDTIAGPDARTSAVLPRAIRAAMRQAEPRLGLPNDALRPSAAKLVATDILISVELAGPLSAVEFNTWEDAEATLRPGLDGVAVRLAGKDGTPGALQAIFPSTMMLTGMLPHRAVGAAVALALGEGGAAGALDDPKKLRTGAGAKMYRFRVTHVAPARDLNSPQVLFRGSRLGPMAGSMSVQELREMGLRSALHLLALGEYSVRPSSGEALSRLLAAYAVAEFVPHAPPGLISLDSRTPLVVQARVLEREPVGTGTYAMGVLASFAGVPPSPPPGPGRALYLGHFKRLVCSAFAPKLLGQPPSPEDARLSDLKQLPIFLHPLVALAALRSSSHEPPDYPVFEGTSRLLRGLYSEGGDARALSLMPWLGWAEIAQADVTRRVTGQMPDDLPPALAFRRVRDQCWKHQLSPADATEDTLDMAGGIVFTSGVAEGRGNPYPTWQCARPLAFIATMLRDPRLTEPAERNEQIVRLMHAARFLRQLQVDEASAWMYPDPALAVGGIRASTWDNSLPIDATSMTLLFTVELIQSLDDLSRQAAPDGSPVAPAATTNPASGAK